MSRLSLALSMLRILGITIAPACSRDRSGPRPSSPTLTIGAEGGTSTDRRVVAAARIAQQWHVGSWSPASITLSSVEAGDAIVVLGVYWGSVPKGADTAPTDDRGRLVAVVDQGPAVVGRVKPPVFAQMYAELDAAPGAHTIVPPWLGGGTGDGTLYVLQIRGLTERRVVASGERRLGGTALPGIDVSLSAASATGDLVIALAGYDNTTPIARAGFHPPDGWTLHGSQEDAANNVPSSLSSTVAPVTRARWSWSDPTANVAAALIAALR